MGPDRRHNSPERDAVTAFRQAVHPDTQSWTFHPGELIRCLGVETVDGHPVKCGRAGKGQVWHGTLAHAFMMSRGARVTGIGLDVRCDKCHHHMLVVTVSATKAA